MILLGQPRAHCGYIDTYQSRRGREKEPVDIVQFKYNYSEFLEEAAWFTSYAGPKHLRGYQRGVV